MGSNRSDRDHLKPGAWVILGNGERALVRRVAKQGVFVVTASNQHLLATEEECSAPPCCDECWAADVGQCGRASCGCHDMGHMCAGLACPNTVGRGGDYCAECGKSETEAPDLDELMQELIAAQTCLPVDLPEHDEEHTDTEYLEALHGAGDAIMRCIAILEAAGVKAETVRVETAEPKESAT